jgi:hypothetical protein
MWRKKKKEAQLVLPTGARYQSGADQDTSLMGIADDLFFNPISALRVSAGSVISQSVRFKPHDLAHHVAFLFLEKALAVSDKKLRIADLRPIDCGVVDFSYDAERHREPDSARSRVRGADAVFGTG